MGGGALHTIARTDNFFCSFPGFTYLADAGVAVFYANRNPVVPTRRGIFVGTGNGLTTQVIDNAGEFNDFGANPTINNLGTVAFAGSLDTPVGGLYLGNTSGDNVTQTVVTNATAPLYNFDGSPFINDNGQVAFKANENATTAPAVFMINQDGSNLRKVAGVSGPYSQLEPPVMNNLGTFVFFAFQDSGGSGIFTGPDENADRVIATGDPLFGSTVASLWFYRGLNNNNEITFFYSLTDGRSGIARARLNLARTPLSVVSRKTHGDVGAFDVNLPMAGTLGVEPRTGGASNAHTIVFTFPGPITLSSVSVTPAPGRHSEVTGSSVLSAGNKVLTVAIGNVDDGQRVFLRVHDVNGGGDVAVPIGILAGDANGDGIVNAGDALLTRNRSGQACTSETFRTDVNGDGLINSGDSLVVRNKAGTALAQ